MAVVSLACVYPILEYILFHLARVDPHCSSEVPGLPLFQMYAQWPFTRSGFGGRLPGGVQNQEANGSGSWLMTSGSTSLK